MGDKMKFPGYFAEKLKEMWMVPFFGTWAK
jgi:hypothetical protein